MTIANMGAELTLTTSVFPSDEITRSYLRRAWAAAATGGRAAPDDDAAYDDQIELDLGDHRPAGGAARARPTAWCPWKRWRGRRSSR